MKDREPRLQSPLSIYVLFHADSREGRALAHALHDWFRLKDDEGQRTDSGLPLWFRSHLEHPADRPESATLTPAIDWDEADDNVVVVLADRHMVADSAWRYALARLCDEAATPPERGRRRLVLPVEVHSALHQLPYLTGQRNAIRIGDPPLHDLPPDSPAWRHHTALRARGLRRAVTEAIARELVLGRSPDAPPSRLDVFLSHAKRDGVDIAERLRDSLAAFGQLRVWYDQTDLPPGYPWAYPMRAAARGLAALVSIVTDAYPTRPWCREEVMLARTPRRMAVAETVERTHSIWRVQPTVAVHRAGSGWSRAMAPLVHVPAIGWSGEPASVSDRIEDIVDRLVLEILVASFQRRLARALAARPRTPEDEESVEKTHVAMLTWVPEPWSLVHVLAELLDPTSPAEPDLDSGPATDASEARNPEPLAQDVSRLVFAYPGHGLRTLERRELERVAEAMVRCRTSSGRRQPPDIRLISQEEYSEGRWADGAPELGLTVCLSGGGKDPELEIAGVGEPHLDELFVRLARRLLAAGCRLVYGGTLARLRVNLTESLIDAARSWMRDQDTVERESDAGGDPDPRRSVEAAAALERAPLVNYSSWPSTRHITLEHRADLVGMCRFESVYPPGRSPESLGDDPAWLASPEAAVLAADALSEMRRLTSAPATCALRVLVGGKIEGASGWLPGIAEELLCAIAAGQPALVLGGFGGCAGLLGAYLADPKAEWPKALTFAARRDDGPMRTLLEHPGARWRAEERFDELRTAVERYRSALHGGDLSPWRLPASAVPDVRELLTCRGPTSTIAHVIGVAEALPPPEPSL